MTKERGHMVESNERFAGTGELSTTEAASTETVEEPKGATEGETQGTEQVELSLEAQLEQAKAENAKLTNDMKAVRGGVKSTNDRDTIMKEVLENQKEILIRQDANDKSNRLVANALAQDKMDELPGQMSQIDAETAQSTAALKANSFETNLFQDLKAATLNDKGESILDLHNSPELLEVRTSWNEMAGLGNKEGLQAVLNETLRIVGREKDKQHTKALAERDKVAEEERKTLLDGKGAMDTDSGPGGGSASSGLKGVARMAKALEK